MGGVAPKERPATAERLSAALGAHFSMVWRTLRRLGVDNTAANDAAHVVFVTFASRAHEIAQARERSFLAGAAIRVAANAQRRKSHRGEEERSPATPDSAWAMEATMSLAQRRELLDRALASLPIEQRTVFVLYELEGFTLPEIAEILELPLVMATSRLRQGRLSFEVWITRQQTGEASR
jgi:RNA polymerase sigma-70 factor (ECF subfamily)